MFRNVVGPFLRRGLELGQGGEKLRPPLGEFAGCDLIHVVAERLREGADALARNSLCGLPVGGVFEHYQLFEEFELNLGPEISNRKNDPEMTEVGRGFVGPLLIKAYRSHDGIDRENGEQDPFIEPIQTPLLKESLRREAQRRRQAGQQERD